MKTIEIMLANRDSFPGTEIDDAMQYYEKIKEAPKYFGREPDIEAGPIIRRALRKDRWEVYELLKNNLTEAEMVDIFNLVAFDAGLHKVNKFASKAEAREQLEEAINRAKGS